MSNVPWARSEAVAGRLAGRAPAMQRMERTLHRLRVAIAKASRDRPAALWPGSEHFWNRHDARLQREMPHLKEHERFNKVFSYLIGTAEDKILSIHMEAQRSAIGSAEFDAMPAEQRDTGCLAFDGLNTERVGDPEAGNEAAEAALVRAGWHAQFWGIEYMIECLPGAHRPGSGWGCSVLESPARSTM